MMLADYKDNYHVWGDPILEDDAAWTALVIEDLLK